VETLSIVLLHRFMVKFFDEREGFFCGFFIFEWARSFYWKIFLKLFLRMLLKSLDTLCDDVYNVTCKIAYIYLLYHNCS